MAKSVTNIIKTTHTIKAKGFLSIGENNEFLIDTEDHGTISVIDLLKEMDGKFVDLSVTEKNEDVIDYE